MAIVVTENIKSRRRRETRVETIEIRQFDIRADMNTAIYVHYGEDLDGNLVTVPSKGDRALWDSALLVATRHFRPVVRGPGVNLTRLEVVYSNRAPTEEELEEGEGEDLEVTLEVGTDTITVLTAPEVNATTGQDRTDVGRMLLMGFDGTDSQGANKLVPNARLVIARNETQVDFETIYALLAHVNVNTWQTMPPQSWLFVDFSTRKILKGIWHFRSRYIFRYDPEKHWEKAPVFDWDGFFQHRYSYHRVYEKGDFNLLQLPAV